MTVYFIGAGPGDADLLTVKGKALIEEADVIVYAGSLINPEILKYAKKEALLYDSSGMTLEEITRVMVEAAKQGRTVVRLHSGDPSLYSALGEQVRALAGEGIECRVVPGISSFQAAAASLGLEYTVPGVVQTVILTRISGRTGVPMKESLRELAKHKASMCIFLSAHRIKKVVEELLESYSPSTPAAVIYRASWKDERVIRGSLAEIADKAKDVKRTALILVGDFLEPPEARSRLYDADFEHGYRRKR
jgi:precorrin-4/cobalt-precorrin-4 C11-methyltransferase